MGMRVGVDIGGTFIDFCLWDEAKEELHSLKVLTTPQTPGAELLRGLDLLQERHGVRPSDITSFVHGTTVGINTVIQRKGASLALITTENFEDVVELARLRMLIVFNFCRSRVRSRQMRRGVVCAGASVSPPSRAAASAISRSSRRFGGGVRR